ncbi:MAG: hypothetical protein ACKPKO_34760, partial [Candidatus Fonsibacter sp.]
GTGQVGGDHRLLNGRCCGDDRSKTTKAEGKSAMEEHTPTTRVAPTAARRRRTLAKLQNSFLQIAQIGQTHSTNQIPSADQQGKMPRRSTGSKSATGRKRRPRNKQPS